MLHAPSTISASLVTLLLQHHLIAAEGKKDNGVIPYRCLDAINESQDRRLNDLRGLWFATLPLKQNENH